MMEILESSNQNSQEVSLSKEIFDPIRNEWVKAAPEEMIRQALIHDMVDRLGYPKDLLIVEKHLREIPHLVDKAHKIPDRRVDILCFVKEVHPIYPFYPLVVIECKAVKLSDKVLAQVQGYNHFLQAYFIAVANEEELRTGWFDPKLGDYRYTHHLPTYHELVSSISIKSSAQRSAGLK